MIKHAVQMAVVHFQGQELLSFHDGTQAHVAIKPICESLGIDWARQLQRIKADPVLSEGIGLKPIPSERGAQDTTTLPLDLLQGWLFKINPDRVKPAARDRVLDYQRECYQVLHDYWFKGAAINPRMAQAIPSPTGDIIKLIEAVKREGNEAARTTLHQLLDQMCSARGIATPPLDQLMLGDLDPRIAAKLDQFWSIIADLEAQGVVINWHRDTSLFAIHYPSLKQIFAEQNVEFTLDSRFRGLLKLSRIPAFKGVGDVNGRDGRGRHSLIFKKIDPEVL